MVTRPRKVSLAIGYVSADGTRNELEAPTAAFGDGVDSDELVAAKVQRRELMTTVNGNLQEELSDKLADIFALLEADLEGTRSSAALAFPKINLVRVVKEFFKAVLPLVEEVTETVQEQVGCPS